MIIKVSKPLFILQKKREEGVMEKFITQISRSRCPSFSGCVPFTVFQKLDFQNGMCDN